jgi:ABC-type Fe3+ transport system permease subunit
MEPLVRIRSPRNPSSLALIGLVFIFVLLPFVFFLVDSIVRFDASSLTPIFFKLLARALLFGGSQALASALLACAFALLMTCAVLSLRPKRRRFLEAPLRISGQLFFVLPGTSIALILLGLPSSWGGVLEGWSLIVLAHVLWSSFFIASHVLERLGDWFEHEGADLLRAARSLGASDSNAFMSTLLPTLSQELRTWFPLVFLWSFGAFSTVFLLGSGPQHSTPEVLLYYTLMNDVDSSRLLVLFVLTFFLQFALIRFFYPLNLKGDVTKFAPPSGIPPEYKKQEQLSVPGARLIQNFAALFLVAAFLLVARYIFPIFLGSTPTYEIWIGLAASWAYALLSCIFVFLFLLWGSASTSSTRRAVFYLLALSPVLLATSWGRIPLLADLALNPWSGLLACALGLALLQIPFALLWVDRAFSALSDEVLLYARSAGLNNRQIFWKIKVPYLRPIFAKILTYTFCISLGEIALAAIWLRDWSLLSLISKRLAQSYDFQAAAWTFVFTLLSALIVRNVFDRVLRRVFP